MFVVVLSGVFGSCDLCEFNSVSAKELVQDQSGEMMRQQSEVRTDLGSEAQQLLMLASV